ncbi:hypothetical protein AFLA_005587 [Aspergillus flavus NRRL3357]|nr:hypothetical protein AFLA_005587 [Aspergillus flavus NRRL3357]
MGAESLAPAEQNNYYPKTQEEQGSQSHHFPESDKPRDSWSLRGFLSRHVSLIGPVFDSYQQLPSFSSRLLVNVVPYNTEPVYSDLLGARWRVLPEEVVPVIAYLQSSASKHVGKNGYLCWEPLHRHNRRGTTFFRAAPVCDSGKKSPSLEFGKTKPHALESYLKMEARPLHPWVLHGMAPAPGPVSGCHKRTTVPDFFFSLNYINVRGTPPKR